MQSGLDRDEHVKIEWNHIINGTERNFNKYNSSVVSDFGIPYDYSSVMHYSAYAFTKDGYATIVPNVSFRFQILSRQMFNHFPILTPRISPTSKRSANVKICQRQTFKNWTKCTTVRHSEEIADANERWGVQKICVYFYAIDCFTFFVFCFFLIRVCIHLIQ